MAKSFVNGDEMPDGILKLVHTQGVVAKVKWEPIGDAGGYGGMMGSVGENIIMRLSETDMLHEESKGLKPSVAFKFLRDGTFSDNIVAMPSFFGSESWNFLEKPMFNRVESFAEDSIEHATIRKKLMEGSRFAFACAVSEIILHKEDGTDTQDKFDWDRPFPWKLSFEANEPYATMFSSEKELDENG